MLVFSTYSPASIESLAVDSSGNIYLTGGAGAGFVTTPGVVQSAFGGGGLDAYVTKLSASGDSLIYSTYLGGSGRDEVDTIAVDSEGAVWVGGSTDTGFPGISGSGGAFLLKLSADGSRIESGSSFGPHKPVGGSAVGYVALDALDNAYAFGYMIQATGPFSPSGFQTTTNAQLSNPCNVFPSGSTFLVETAPNGDWVYASYACQLDAILVLAPGHLFTHSNSASMPYLTTPPPMNTAAATNAASYSPAIAPGEVVSLFGAGLGPTNGVVGEPDANGRYPTSLAGVQMTFSGVPAPLLYVQSGQLNAVVPREVGSSTIQVNYQGQTAPSVTSSTQAFNPGVFAVVNQDGTVNSKANPAHAGSTISIYATGAGAPPLPDGQIVPLSPLFPFDAESRGDAVLLSGIPGAIVWEGAAPGLILGVNQINVQIPPSLPVSAPSTSMSMIVQCAMSFNSQPFAVFVAP